MHEVSIAQAVVSTVVSAVGPRQVTAVTLRVGVMSSVVPQALTFAWDVVTVGTTLAGSQLVIDAVSVRTRCHACHAEAICEPALPVRCSACEARDVEVVAGTELMVGPVEVADDVDLHLETAAR